MSLRVDGEAFNISDGDPQPFGDFCRHAWRYARDTTKPEDVTVIPGWIALGMASTIEWTFRLFTLGLVRPPIKMSRLYIQVTIYNSTFNIDKARKRLGYEPIVDHEGNMKRSIEWELKNRQRKPSGFGAA